MDTSPSTRQLAVQELGLDPMDIDFTQPTVERERWNQWRSQKIANYTQQVRNTIQQIKPQVALSAFVLPPEFKEVGQNLQLISPYLDQVLPMAYFEDWHFPPTWTTGRLLNEVNQLKAKNTTIKLTLDGSGSNQQNVAILQSMQKSYPHIQAVAWFSAFYWHPEGLERIVKIHRQAASNAVK
jgi:hypothetical protein